MSGSVTNPPPAPGTGQDDHEHPNPDPSADQPAEGLHTWKARKFDELVAAKAAEDESAHLAALNLDKSGTSVKDLMAIFKRQEKYSKKCGVPIVQWLRMEHQWVRDVQVSPDSYGRVAVTNLDPINKKEFMDSYAKDCDDLTWKSFHDLMVALYQKPDAARLARRKLYSCHQNARPVSTFSTEWKSLLADIELSEQPNMHDQLFLYSEGLDKEIQKLTAVDFSTNLPYTDLTALMNAAHHIGSSNVAASPGSSSNHSGASRATAVNNKKRSSSSKDTTQGAVKPSKKPNQGLAPGAAPTPSRGDATQKLRESGLCFHCCGKINMKGESFSHRVADCPFKQAGVAAAPLPKNFA